MCEGQISVRRSNGGRLCRNAKISKRNVEPLERAKAVVYKSLGAKNDKPRKLLRVHS